MDKNKLIKLAIIIVIAILLVLGFYKWFSLAEESENTNTDNKKTSTEESWSTYRDAENGVSFQYPTSWERQALQEGIIGYAREDGTNVTFTVEDLSENPVTLEEYNEAALAGLDALEFDITILESEDITSDGLPGHTLTYTAAGDKFTTRIQQIWIVKNNKAYIISFTSTAESYQNVSDIGDTILESLQIE